MTKGNIEQTEIEAPYELPEGWKWCRLGDVFEINPKVKADDALQASFIPMEKIEPNNKNQFSFSVDLWGKIKKNHTQFQNGDVCFAKISPCFENGKAFIADGLENGIGSGTTELIVLRNHDIDSKYTFYFVSDLSFIRKGCATYSGTVGQQRISMDFVKSYPFPIPPTLAEQKRIVSRIETLFVKLDEAEERTRAVLDGFETRKAAILHKAFTGELTASWRKANGVADDSWEEKTYKELGDSKLGKMLDEHKNSGRQVKYLRNVNIRWFDFDLTDVKTMLAHDDEIKKLSVQKGDLFICEGGEPGRCAVWEGENSEIIFQKALHRFRANENVLSNFLCYDLYYLAGNGKLAEYFTGTTIKHLTGQSLEKIPVQLPSLPEQQEIVRILDSLLDKESRAKEAAQTVLDKIALLKKSILARAFRGEV